MRLIELRIDGFGKLADRTFSFDPGVNVVYGPNEAGKSTLTHAIVATLYGLTPRSGEREAWRPWRGARFATMLRYALADGSEFEVQRDFERDAKSGRVYDRDGNDVSTEVSIGKHVAPGVVHLKVPLEVFLNAACVRQGAVELNGSQAERIGTTLAHALDGGPREDAALGAIKALKAALAAHVGTKAATVRTPLRDLRDDVADRERTAAALRARLRELGELRMLADATALAADELRIALAEHERLGRALRARRLRTRLTALSALRGEIAALHAERTRYDDVAGFASECMTEVEARHRVWVLRDAQATAGEDETTRAQLLPAALDELAERGRDGGAVDDATFEQMEAASAAAADARLRAAAAGNAMNVARR
ncbi:MAG: ATP-binding protein, partial [Vulcanimicrobiaceae bacterium]